MSETKKYVSLENLELYTPLIKDWFVEQINSTTVMNLDYDEENRILKFIGIPYSSVSDTTNET